MAEEAQFTGRNWQNYRKLDTIIPEHNDHAKAIFYLGLFGYRDGVAMYNSLLDIVFTIVTPFLLSMSNQTHKGNSILYCRVSSAKSAQEGESL